MSIFESSVKQIPYAQQLVFDTVSDLSNIDRVKDRMPEGKIQDLTYDHDSVSVDVPPVGTISMRIVDRENPKTVKYETTNSPVPFNLWVQLLPTGENSCKMKLTVKAELNPFIKGMVSKPLQEAVEKIADMLAVIPYGG